VVLGKDYLTGHVGDGGPSADFSHLSFEATTHAWVFRGYGNVALTTDFDSANGDGTSPPLGVYKNTTFGNGLLNLRNFNLDGSFANGDASCPLVEISGIDNTILYKPSGANIYEEDTQALINVCSTATNVQSMLAQSGIQAVGTIITPVGFSIPGSANAVPLTLINDNTGHLQTSASTGCLTGGTCTPNTLPMYNPTTTWGDLLYGGAAGAPARLAGNTSTNAEVLVSQGS